MTHAPLYLDRPAAERLLTQMGFNGLDVECVLDLTAPRIENGMAFWPVTPLERLAVRAYWLGEQAFDTDFGQAA